MRMNSPKHLKRSPTQRWDTSDILLPNEWAQAEEPVDWATLFPDAPEAPVEIEIGVGKGTFLLDRAKRHPELNFLGIEYAGAYAAYVADRVRRAELPNVKMLACDAGPFVTHRLLDESVFRVHVYFPDPWPKRRHRRRRLIQPPFVEQARRILQPGGQLLLVTDHRDYFEQIAAVIADAPGFARCEFPKLIQENEDDAEKNVTAGKPHIVGTNFEKKYIEEGRCFFRAALMKYR